MVWGPFPVLKASEIVVEDDVKHPVQAVFGAPAGADSGGEGFASSLASHS